MKQMRNKLSLMAVLGAMLLVISSCDVKRQVALRQMANFFEKVERNPVTRTPAESGLEYSDVTFKSLDDVNLSAWYIPCDGSDKLVVFNHFMVGNKAGAVPHEDWGNVAVDFLPIYKHLVDAGYNVLTYDLRNHGESDVYNEGKLGLTTIEYQDVVASVRYARENYPNKDIYLYSQCYGTISTIRAMYESPEDFINIKAYINLQPMEPTAFVEAVSKKFKIWEDDNLDIFENQLERKTGYTYADVKIPAQSVKIPTLTVQVHDDWRITPESVEKIHNDIDNKDKKLLWIEGTDERLDGYNYFGDNPEEMIAWFDSH
jgi:pimeloyl-ACP methyl ester carboxylesterase